MNLLKNETSPYLQQHAHHPVNWMPWGEEAFEQAKKENKPILLSIGYSSCHWCHVMAHESFEDIETAQLMNQLFINIKLDREEYPDIDHYYMDAVQAMTGSGGWPLNVFLTPEKKAFYGGTYFPPKPLYGRASWKEVLQKVSHYFNENRDAVESQAHQLLTHLKNANQLPTLKNEQTDEKIFHEKILEKILKNADTEEGGFGTAPKFPATFTIKLLLDYFQLYQSQDALTQACITLDKMAYGGIYDQIRGGFARYSTDKYWKAPHFEKMLYDNALLIEVYSIAFAITKNNLYQTIVRETVEWLKAEMRHESGAFYSAIDADSEGQEGKYYTWNYAELKEILKEDFSKIETYYQIQKAGNWEHTNILWTNHSLIENIDPSTIQRVKKILLHEREKRIKPFKDKKILLGWNALMIKALAQASLIFNNDEYFMLAEQALNYIQTTMKSDEHLYYHTCMENIPKIPAYLDDLAFLADAFISLNHASGKASYIQHSAKIIRYLIENFKEENEHFFCFTNKKYQQTSTNKIDIYDGALPSSNAVTAKVIKYMATINLDNNWAQISDEMLQRMKSHIEEYPTSFSIWANIALVCEPNYEVNIVGKEAVARCREMYQQIYKPNIRLLLNADNDIDNASIKSQYSNDKTHIYVCYEHVCLAPFASNEELITFFFK